MATQKQLEANRRNAQKSCGPTTLGGKKRSSRNAATHNLNSEATRAAVMAAAEPLAREIALADRDRIDFDLALRIAEAKIELDMVHSAKVDVTNRIIAFGTLDPLYKLKMKLAELQPLFGSNLRLFKTAPEALAPLPREPRERSFEATRRAIPALEKLQRYERRSSAKLDLAVRKAMKERLPASS